MALPKNVKIPSSNQFMKFQEGANKFRVLSDVITGWEGWKNNVPFRHAGDVCKIKPEQVDLNQNGKPNINYFWAMVVWNIKDQVIQTLELTQKTIMGTLYEFEEGGDWGDLKDYDITIHKKTEGKKTSYTVTPNKPAPVPLEVAELYKNTDIDLNKLFDGKYPIEEAGADDYESMGEDEKGFTKSLEESAMK
jgi:hypothetical protein